MNFKDIEYFIEVAEKSSLSCAAECIGISQPSLSLSMKRLEKEMGTLLLNRFKTGVKLTPAGKILRRHAKQLVQNWEEVKNSAHDATFEMKGLIRIGCHPSVSNYHLPEAFFALLSQHQSLNVNFYHALSREVNAAIINLEVDLGIVVNPNYHPDLVIKKLFQDKVGLWHNFDVEPSDALTLICDPDLKQSQVLITQLKKQYKISRVIESNNFELLYRLAQEKVGVAVLPISVVQSKESMHLKPLLPELYYLDDICLVYRNENRFIKSIASLIACFTQAYSRVDIEN